MQAGDVVIDVRSHTGEPDTCGKGTLLTIFQLPDDLVREVLIKAGALVPTAAYIQLRCRLRTVSKQFQRVLDAEPLAWASQPLLLSTEELPSPALLAAALISCAQCSGGTEVLVHINVSHRPHQQSVNRKDEIDGHNTTVIEPLSNTLCILLRAYGTGSTSHDSSCLPTPWALRPRQAQARLQIEQHIAQQFFTMPAERFDGIRKQEQQMRIRRLALLRNLMLITLLAGVFDTVVFCVFHYGFRQPTRHAFWSSYGFWVVSYVVIVVYLLICIRHGCR